MEVEYARTYRGRTVCGGTVEGAAAVCSREMPAYPIPAGVEEELMRFERAKSEALGQLAQLEAEVAAQAGGRGRRDLAVHRLLLEDFTLYVQMAEDGIRVGKSAQEAVHGAGRTCAAMFEQMEDPYLRERGADLMDISARVIACLNGCAYPPESGPEAILIAEDFSPSQVAAWQRGGNRAMILSEGSEYSHAAILARAFGAPMLVQTGIAVDELAGKQIKGSVEAGEEGGLGRVILEAL